MDRGEARDGNPWEPSMQRLGLATALATGVSLGAGLLGMWLLDFLSDRNIWADGEAFEAAWAAVAVMVLGGPPLAGGIAAGRLGRSRPFRDTLKACGATLGIGLLLLVATIPVVSILERRAGCTGALCASNIMWLVALGVLLLGLPAMATAAWAARRLSEAGA